MVWSWSHTRETYDNVKERLSLQDTDWLQETWAEWKTARAETARSILEGYSSRYLEDVAVQGLVAMMSDHFDEPDELTVAVPGVSSEPTETDELAVGNAITDGLSDHLNVPLKGHEFDVETGSGSLADCLDPDIHAVGQYTLRASDGTDLATVMFQGESTTEPPTVRFRVDRVQANGKTKTAEGVDNDISQQIAFNASFDSNTFEAFLDEAQPKSRRDMVETIWDNMSELRTCDNGGFNAHACPYNDKHKIPFKQPEQAPLTTKYDENELDQVLHAIPGHLATESDDDWFDTLAVSTNIGENETGLIMEGQDGRRFAVTLRYLATADVERLDFGDDASIGVVVDDMDATTYRHGREVQGERLQETKGFMSVNDAMKRIEERLDVSDQPTEDETTGRGMRP